MTDENKTETHDKDFFLYSLRSGRTDITLNIPAESANESEELLAEIVMHPENWERERAIENKLNERKTSGRRKGPKPWTPPLDNGTGPMYG